MARKTLPPEQRQQELMETAMELFRTQGVENTPVSDIVKQAGVAQGTFYWYFKSKDELVNKIIQMIAGKILGDILTLIDSSEHSALEKFEHIRQMLMGLLSHRRALERFHRNENSHYHDQLTREIGQRLVPAIARVIEQGIAEGVFASQHPERDAAFALGACMGVPEDPDLFRDESVLGEWLDSLFAFVLRGLGYEE